MRGAVQPAGQTTRRRRRRADEGTRITIIEMKDGFVGAEVTFGEDDLSADGGPTLEAIVALANDLAGRGAAREISAGQSVLPIETSIRQFSRGAPGRLAATARRLQGSSATMVWHVTLAAEGACDEPFAIVTQTQTVDGGAPHVPQRSRAPATHAAAVVPRPATAKSEHKALSRRREQIVAAAADIISRKGYANASIREIADAAGLHVPTLYQYIASKDEVLELVYSRTMASLQTDIAAEVASYASAEQKLRVAIDILLGQSDEFRHRIGLLNRELKSLSPQARTRVLDQYRDLLGSLADIIRAGVSSGEFRAVEPEIAANLATAASDMWALRQFAIGHFGVETYGSEITAFIIRGLLRA